ncbi:hypothetical protein AV530_014302 [Patagioenas fasciata monilis]|uniref:Uncharacterized protein n=1 Tax=Patagioenas fasciata monilis TaxID=372326 RepID=A0A1V4KBF0_PATFA|nr:hypothetical protein AV530_014302 [Patagioenas fasciata monilis]
MESVAVTICPTSKLSPDLETEDQRQIRPTASTKKKKAKIYSNIYSNRDNEILKSIEETPSPRLCLEITKCSSRSYWSYGRIANLPVNGLRMIFEIHATEPVKFFTSMPMG